MSEQSKGHMQGLIKGPENEAWHDSAKLFPKSFDATHHRPIQIQPSQNAESMNVIKSAKCRTMGMSKTKIKK
jgi:hypothetical protein